MSESYEAIRYKATIKPPLGFGTWETENGAKITVAYSDRKEIRLYVGDGDAVSDYWIFNAPSLRELASFCNEEADQLDRS